MLVLASQSGATRAQTLRLDCRTDDAGAAITVLVEPPTPRRLTLAVAGVGAVAITAEELGVDVALAIGNGTDAPIRSAAAPGRAAIQLGWIESAQTAASWTLTLEPGEQAAPPAGVRVRAQCVDAHTARAALTRDLAAAQAALYTTEYPVLDPDARTTARHAAIEAFDDVEQRASAMREWRHAASAAHSSGLLRRRLNEFRAAVDALSRADALWRRAQAERQTLYARFHLAKSRIGLADYRGAVADLESLLPLAIAARETYVEAIARNDLCMARRYLGELRAALACYASAQALFDRTGDDAEWINTTINVAQVHVLLGETAQARAVGAGAARRAAVTGDPLSLIHSAHFQALLELAQGNLDQAVAQLEPALSASRRIGDGYWEATLLMVLADVRRLNGDVAGAGSLLAQAVTRFESTQLPERAAAAAMALVQTQLDMGVETLAETTLRLAQAHYAYAGNRVGLADATTRLAQLAWDRGDAEASHRLLQGQRWGDSFGKHAPTYRRWLLLRSRMSLAESDAPRALRLLERAKANAGSDGDLDFELRWRRQRAQALAALDHRDEALRELDAAIELALRAQQRVRAPLLRSYLGRLARDIAIDYVALRLDRSTHPGDTAAAADALMRFDAAKAPILRGYLDFFAPGKAPATATEAAERERLLRVINEAAVARIVSGQSSISQFVGAQAIALDSALAALDRLDAGANTDPSPATRAPPADAGRLTAALGDHETVLYFVVATPRSFRFALSRAGIRFSVLPPAAVLQQAIAGFVGRVEDRNSSMRELVDAGAPLSRWLLDADAPAAGQERVHLILDGPLQDLPFAALPLASVPDPASRASIYTPALTRFEFDYLPALISSRTSRALVARERGPLRIAVLGAPELGTIPAGRDYAENRRGRKAPFAALPSAQREVDAVRVAWAPTPVSTFVGRELNAAHLKLVLGEAYDVVHVASHAIVDQRRPDLSGVLVSAAVGSDAPWALVTWRELFDAPTHARLVVLNTCRSGAGAVSPPEGTLSLARAMLYSGAEHVVANLWDVDDVAAAELTRRFYAALPGAETPAAALRAAQLDMAASRRFRHPSHWSATVGLRACIGSCSPWMAERSTALTPP